MNRRHRCAADLGAAFAVYVGAPTALAQEAVPSEASLPTIEPIHHLQFGDAPVIQNMVFSADGDTLYVNHRILTIDVWDTFVRYWPEVLSTVCVISAITSLVLLWRIFKRPRSAGEPYCRKCNYHLAAHVTRPSPRERWRAMGDNPRCPECGAKFADRAPVTGRSLRSRLLTSCGPTLVLLAVLASMWFAKVPRYGPVTRWFDWRWEWLAALIVNRESQSMQFHLFHIDRIRAIDPRTGRTLRIVGENGWISRQMLLTPDGQGLLLHGRGWEDSPFVVMHAQTGDLQGVGSYAEDAQPSAYLRELLGFPPNSQEFMAILGGRRQLGRAHLVRTDLETGSQVEELVDEGYQGGSMIENRHFLLAAGSDTPLILTLPTLAEVRDAGRYTIRAHRVGSEAGADVMYDFPGDSSSISAAVADDQSLFAIVGYDTIRQVNALTGEFITDIPVRDKDFSIRDISFDPSGRYLFAACFRPNEVLIYDLQQERWLASLKMTNGWVAQNFSASPCGRYFAITATWHRSYGRPFRRFIDVPHSIIIYDISSLADGL